MFRNGYLFSEQKNRAIQTGGRRQIGLWWFKLWRTPTFLFHTIAIILSGGCKGTGVLRSVLKSRFINVQGWDAKNLYTLYNDWSKEQFGE